MSRASLALTIVVAGLLAAAPAGAAFPGGDGRVAFTSGGDLHTVLPDGSGIAALTATPGDEEAQAAWSPDGARVAFRVGRPSTGDVLQIAVMNADGTGRTVLTSGDRHSSQPAWSPDGRLIVYRRSVPGDNLSGDIWVMGADGSAPHALFALAGDERYPAFAPDGRRLALTTHPAAADDVEIAVADIAAGTVATLTANSVFDSAPSWSPDGLRIAFERGPKGDDPGNDVWSMAADGTGQRQLTTTAGVDEGPVFSPGGTRIVFASRRTGSSDIWTMAADGSDQRLLAALPGGKDESPDWQPLPLPATGPPATDYPIPPPPAVPTLPRPPATGIGGGTVACSYVPGTHVCAHDRDADGLTDARERRLGTSSLDRDSDDDGLTDGVEVVRRHTSPRRRDTDRDGLLDGLELGVTLRVADPRGRVRGTDPRRFRPDADPSTRTDPRRRDTDRDGVVDGREDRNHNGRRDPGERDPRAA